MSEKVKSVFSLEDLGISVAEEDLAIMPSGGEVFGAGTFIAPFQTEIFAAFMSQESLVDYNETVDDEDKLPMPYRKFQGGDWYSYYYRDFGTAVEARKNLDPDGRKVKSHWLIWTETASIINAGDLDAVAKGFGDVLHLNAQVMALRSGSSAYPANNRHKWCLLTLPSLIAAAADIMGIQNDGFDISDLMDADVEFTQERYVELCGDPEGRWEDADLYRRREKLWKSLGEDDGLKAARENSKTAAGKPNKLATSSSTLSRCLGLAQGKWGAPLWLRLALVPDPRPEAVSGSDNRRSIPAVVEIFGPGAVGETRARAAALEEAEENGGAATSTHPPLPKNWTGKDGGEKVLVEWLKKYFADPANANKPPNIQAGEGELYMDSVDLMNQWKVYAGIG